MAKDTISENEENWSQKEEFKNQEKAEKIKN